MITTDTVVKVEQVYNHSTKEKIGSGLKRFLETKMINKS